MDAPIVKCLWIVIGVKRLINVDQSAAELHKNIIQTNEQTTKIISIKLRHGLSQIIIIIKKLKTEIK